MGNCCVKYARAWRMLKVIVPLGLALNKLGKRNQPGDWSIRHFWDQVCDQHGTALAILYQDKQYTYTDLDRLSNQLARTLLVHGCQPGDTVALCLPNGPEYLIALLALCKLGLTGALLNPSVTGKALVHCLNICNATRVLFDASTLSVIQSIPVEKQKDLQFYYYSEGDETMAMGIKLSPSYESEESIDYNYVGNVRLTDAFLHIFTSGTTGLPKAAKINHLRFYGAGMLFSRFADITKSDRIYATLPLYHGSGLMIGWGMCLQTGCCLVLREKFSATQFWSDCVKYKVTVVQYIGELCRYLVNTPESTNDRIHEVRLAIGNGLRQEIWPQFKERFNIPRIMEFYASTEGNTGFINTENQEGAIGFISPIVRAKHPARFLRYDFENDSLVRDPDTGFCIECEIDEPGELVALIDNQDVTRRFDGYSDENETKKKIMRNVLVEGDTYFCSGDLMRVDKDGFVYFVDRLGDTFRWKGENVSTTEITATISNLQNGMCKDVAVYGVTVGNCEGRAGMALIVPAENFSLSALYDHLQQLPPYAQPLFIRISTQPIQVTETFKHRKHVLAEEGFNPSIITDDQLYFRDDARKEFVLLPLRCTMTW